MSGASSEPSSGTTGAIVANVGGANGTDTHALQRAGERPSHPNVK